MDTEKLLFEIEAATSGEGDVKKLANTLRGVADTLDGPLKDSALAAADKLDALGAKQAAIDKFSQLKREGQTLGQELNQVSSSVDSLGTQLEQAAAHTQDLTQQQARATQAFKQSEQAVEQVQAQLKALQADFKAGAVTTEDYKARSQALNTELAQSKSALEATRSTLTQANGAQKAAAIQLAELDTAYNKATIQAGALSGQVRTNTKDLEAARTAMQQQGLSTQNLTEQFHR